MNLPRAMRSRCEQRRRYSHIANVCVMRDQLVADIESGLDAAVLHLSRRQVEAMGVDPRLGESCGDAVEFEPQRLLALLHDAARREAEDAAVRAARVLEQQLDRQARRRLVLSPHRAPRPSLDVSPPAGLRDIVAVQHAANAPPSEPLTGLPGG